MALPAKSDADEIARVNNKTYTPSKGSAVFSVAKVDPTTGEVAGVFESIQPSDTEMGAHPAKDVKVTGEARRRNGGVGGHPHAQPAGCVCMAHMHAGAVRHAHASRMLGLPPADNRAACAHQHTPRCSVRSPLRARHPRAGLWYGQLTQ